MNRCDVGYRRTLGDFLARIAHHESIHAGQSLGYMRMVRIERWLERWLERGLSRHRIKPTIKFKFDICT